MSPFSWSASWPAPACPTSSAGSPAQCPPSTRTSSGNSAHSACFSSLPLFMSRYGWRMIFTPRYIYLCDLDHSHRGSGSTPSNSYFWPLGVLPVLLYHFCGSTSYEYSQCLFFNSLGVVPQVLYHFCGSTWWEWYSICGSTPRLLENRHWEYS